MSKVRSLAIAAAVVVSVVFVATAAVAVGGRPPPTWEYLTCATPPTGRLGAVTIGELRLPPEGASSTLRPGHELVTQVSVTPCATPGATHVFAVAAFYANSAWAFPRFYTSTTRSGAAGVVAVVGADVRALCLVTDYRTRLGCVEVSWAGVGSVPVIGGTVPNDSPVVRHLVFLPPVAFDGPGCPVCWSL